MDEDYVESWKPRRASPEPRSLQAQVDAIMEILANPANGGAAGTDWGPPYAWESERPGTWRDTADRIVARLEREQRAAAEGSGQRFSLISPAQAQIAVPVPLPPPAGAPGNPDLGRQLIDFLSSLVTAAQRRIGERVDAARREGGYSFQSYVKDNLVRPEIYSGRTSGPKLPGENVAARGLDNHPPDGVYEAPRLDCSSDSYGAIRGREQQLIDHFEPMGLSANRINGISPWNPLRGYYLRRGREECGFIPMPKSRWESQ